MATKVYVSFDWDNDKQYKFLLDAWNKNKRFDFRYPDGTPEEIQSNDVGRVKAALTAKINEATHTLVIIGAEANSRHRDSARIGHKNWINFEIARSKEARNKIIGVRIEDYYQLPEEILGCNATYIDGFKADDIGRAIGW